MIDVSGEITEHDYLHAQTVHAKSRVLLRIGVTLALAGYVLVAVWLFVRDSASERPALLLTCALPALLIAGIVVVGRLLQRRTYRRQRSLRGTHRYALSDAGVTVDSPHGHGEIRWSAFVRWQESPEVFLLYQADNLFHMLPKRWFEGDEQRLEACRVLLEEQVG